MTVHQLACKWLLMDPALTSITGTLLNEAEIKEACDAVDKPKLSAAEMQQLADEYNAIGTWAMKPTRAI